ncbi:MAG TPA: hypothetical protein VMM77_01690 [Gemmatimonadaceae bacterium]|nr:hypothetical protein [Gemmatimonadaceae bacterium]
MGCFRTIGCAVVLLVVLAATWFFREDIGRLVARDGAAPAGATEAVWEPLTPEGAARAREVVARLDRRTGRVYENVKPADLSALVFEELSKQALPPSASEIEAATVGSTLAIRANVRLSDFGGKEVLGPLASLLDEREQVQFGGVLQVVRPGLAQYRVSALRIGRLDVPPPLIPRLLRRIGHGARPDGVADDALPLEIPAHIGDVRIGANEVTLIKTST